MALKDYAGKHSSEWPATENIYDSVLLGAWADPPGTPRLVVIGDQSEQGIVQIGAPKHQRDVVLCTPNRELGGADAVVVVSDDGIWIKGLDEHIERRVAEELAKKL